MIWAKLCFTSLILVIFCFTDFDCLRNKGFSNAIPTGTFTNISNKNMKGSRTYDHIWLTKETKNITSGNDPILPNFKIYLLKFSWVEYNISIRWIRSVFWCSHNNMHIVNENQKEWIKYIVYFGI